MPFVVGYGIAIIGAMIAYQLSKGKTEKRKNENTLFGE